jgi:hypothetical protein
MSKRTREAPGKGAIAIDAVATQLQSTTPRFISEPQVGLFQHPVLGAGVYDSRSTYCDWFVRPPKSPCTLL